MHDRLSPISMCSGLCDLVKFLEVSHNMSALVQDNDIIVTEN